MEPNRLYCVLRMLAPVCRGRTFLSGTWEISRKCDIFESHNNTWEADVTLPPPPPAHTDGRYKKARMQFTVLSGLWEL